MFRALGVVLLATVLLSFTADRETRTREDFLLNYLSVKYPEFQFDSFLYVEVKSQQMHLIEGGTILRSYPISTAAKGIGSEKNSEKTPLGLHTIYSKIGDGAPEGGILRGKNYTGQNAKIHTDTTRCDGDHVTTRAMRLRGVENGVNKGGNVDTFSRFIYIHGTPEEGLIGTPVSHGCIRMKNKDVVELYGLIKNGTKVVILNL